MDTDVNTNHEGTEMPIGVSDATNSRGQWVKIVRFLWHLAQMIIAMEVGMLVYHMVIYPLLFPNASCGCGLTNVSPLVSYWMMVASMTLPMIALMKLYHKSSWGYSLGMTATMLAPLAALSVLVTYALIPIYVLHRIGDPLMFVTMAAFLLLCPNDGAQPACHSA